MQGAFALTKFTKLHSWREHVLSVQSEIPMTALTQVDFHWQTGIAESGPFPLLPHAFTQGSGPGV